MNTRWLMVVVLVTGWMLTDAGMSETFGQQRERLIGGGRLMRKIFGMDDPDEKSSKSASKKSDANRSAAKSKLPKGAKTPTLANRPTAAKVPKPSSSQPRRDTRTVPGRTSQADAARATKSATRSDQKATQGFGMLLEQRGENLIVRQLDSKGNAAEAGLKRNDVVLSGGGVEFGNVDEFNQIAEILKNGDQLEFEIERRGKKDKLMIQFGKAPKPADDAKLVAPGKTSTQLQANEDLELDLKINSKDHFSFVPTNKERPRKSTASRTQSRSGSPMQSVLGNVVPGSNSASSRAPQMKPIQPLVTPAKPTSSQTTSSSDQLRRQLRLQQLEIERLRRQLNQSAEKANQSGQSNSGSLELSGPGR